jgi:hypothetical protein
MHYSGTSLHPVPLPTPIQKEMRSPTGKSLSTITGQLSKYQKDPYCHFSYLILFMKAVLFAQGHIDFNLKYAKSSDDCNRHVVLVLLFYAYQRFSVEEKYFLQQ